MQGKTVYEVKSEDETAEEDSELDGDEGDDIW
jgi:hypothetical protein